MALNECSCGCDGPHDGTSQAEWASRLANIVDHVAPARAQPVQAETTSTQGAEPTSGAAPGFSICLDAVALPPDTSALDGRLSLIISPAGVVPEPRLHVASDRCECDGVTRLRWIPL